ncbi:MAG: hypothetical protein HY782_21715 [Chloroflexi bacterium]|nr:hypothetical protein [Chloroflexota bacterium]
MRPSWSILAIVLSLMLTACGDSPAVPTVVPTATSTVMPTRAPTFAPSLTPTAVVPSPTRPPNSATPTRTAGSPGQGLAQIPACPEMGKPLFTTMPMALDEFLAFRPLGWTSPPIHVFPAKHSNFALARPGETPPTRAVYFPGDLWVTEINSTEYVGLNKTGYGLTFYPCREFKSYFGHLSGVSDKILAQLKTSDVQCKPPYETGGTPVKACSKITLLRVNAGELAGYSGDAAGVDFGAVDYRIPPLGFANPNHYMKEMLHYVSPVGYFTSEVKAQFETKLASYDGTALRTAEPKVGLYMQDIPGTAQGNWFLPGKNLAIPFLQPDEFMALVHDYIGAAEPIFSVGTSVKGLRVGVYGFHPQPAGQINRDFGQVKADGSIYCYDTFRVDRTAGGIPLGRPNGILLLTMPTTTTLRIEKQGTATSTCASTTPWIFTDAATTFER